MPIEDVASQQDVRLIGTGNNLDHNRAASPNPQLDQECRSGSQNASERGYLERPQLHEFQFINHIYGHGGDVRSRINLSRNLAGGTGAIRPRQNYVDERSRGARLVGYSGNGPLPFAWSGDPDRSQSFSGDQSHINRHVPEFGINAQP